MNTKSYLHNCNSGDLIAALPGIRHIYRTTGKKAVIYQQLDCPGLYAQGIDHSVKSDSGKQVTMNQKMFDMLRPLLVGQSYIEDFIVYNGQHYDVDLTVIREEVDYDDETNELSVRRPKAGVNIPHMALQGWLMTAYPHMACNIAEPWIELKNTTGASSGLIVVNRTERYQCPDIKYTFLRAYQKELVFAGTPREYARFREDFGLVIPYLEITDFLDLAFALDEARFFVGNQSFPWNLANGIGMPRLLEMCSWAPNCQPFVGENNYGALHQLPFETAFDLLYKKTAARKEQLS